MAIFAAALPSLIGAAGSLIGGKKKSDYLTQGDIAGAYKAGTGRFNFNPNADDPGLKLQQIRANQMYKRNRYRGQNELQRSGLAGSSIGLRGLQDIDADYSRDLQGMQYGNLQDQRQEQLGMFNSDQDYMRKLQMARLGALQQGRSADASSRSSSIGSLGETGGALFGQYLNRGKNPPVDFNADYFTGRR